VAKLEAACEGEAGAAPPRVRVRVTVLRRGGVSVQQLEECLAALCGASALRLSAAVEVAPLPPPRAEAAAATPADDSPAAEAVAAEAPGMLLSHYAPDVPAYLVAGLAGAAGAAGSGDAALRPPLAHSVVIDLGGALASLRSGCLAYADLSPSRSVAEARRRIFETLRWAEGVAGARAVLIADPLLAWSAQAGGGAAATAAAANDDKDDDRQHIDALRDRMFRAASGKVIEY
jgi:hypothetical protein